MFTVVPSHLGGDHSLLVQHFSPSPYQSLAYVYTNGHAVPVVTVLCSPQVNLPLLIFSFVGFLLPCYLYYFRRKLLQEQAAKEGTLDQANGTQVKLQDTVATNGLLSNEGSTA